MATINVSRELTIVSVIGSFTVSGNLASNPTTVNNLVFVVEQTVPVAPATATTATRFRHVVAQPFAAAAGNNTVPV